MLRVYNTMTRQMEVFEPLHAGKVLVYQCGPTVYSRQHIGNLFSPVKGDFLRRALMYLGYEVNYVINITDVGHLVSDGDSGEDKMEKGMKKEGAKTPAEIATKFTSLYHQDLAELNTLKPVLETVATQYITQMAVMVQELIDKEYAYATKEAIYFEVDKFPGYTNLNRHKLEMNRQGAGHGEVEDLGKKKPYDFAVWFFKTGPHKHALQTWDYEFNGIEQEIKSGFPGWHIECSAMSRDALGDTIDIHIGGREHIPVHHTNEIAQSEAATGQKFVNYWLHHEWLFVDGGKMSKSIGNIYTLNDIVVRGFQSLSYRYFLTQAHYRSQQNFTWEAMGSADSAYKKLKKKIENLESKQGEVIEAYKKKFILALEDDFNIPQAIALVWDLLKTDYPDGDKFATISDFDRVFGLELTKFETNELEQTPEIKELLGQRAQARENKDWAKSDQIREQLLLEHKILVEDKSEGQIIKSQV